MNFLYYRYINFLEMIKIFDLGDLYNPPLPSDYRAQLQKANAYYKKIAAAFSPEFFEEFSQTHAALSQLELDCSYREGFQAGVLFMTRSLLSGPGERITCL